MFDRGPHKGVVARKPRPGRKEGGFKRGDQRGMAFATSRLAAGHGGIRDMIVDAWADSPTRRSATRQLPYGKRARY